MKYSENIEKSVKSFDEALDEFMDWAGEEETPTKENSHWEVAGDFDLILPGAEAEFIPELNEAKEIYRAFETGERFSVPFATEDILKMSIATGNGFWLGQLEVLPVFNGNNVGDWGFEVSNWNGRAIAEYFFSDYYPTDLYLLLNGADFNSLAEDINAFGEGFNG